LSDPSTQQPGKNTQQHIKWYTGATGELTEGRCGDKGSHGRKRRAKKSKKKEVKKHQSKGIDCNGGDRSVDRSKREIVRDLSGEMMGGFSWLSTKTPDPGREGIR
jgi:hypothetical protein